MVDQFANLMTSLGEHFYLVLFSCIEIVFAVFLLSVMPKLPRRAHTSRAVSTGNDRQMLAELNRQTDSAYLVLRRSDMMPIHSVGNLTGITGLTFERIQQDLTYLLGVLQKPDEGRYFWVNYRKWDGKAPLATEMQLKHGEWVDITVQRSRDNELDIFYFRNTTATHKRIEGYEKQLERAESASQFKTSFLFRMSHEIRTPMNGVAGMLTLAESHLTPDHPAMQYLTKADELSAHLLSLINDILDMSRIEAGKIELEERAFSLNVFGAKLYDMFIKTLNAKGIHYAVNFEEMTVDWVIGDELRISQVIINFLSNAVKFTSKGEVTVTFRQMLLQDGKVDLMMRVHDTGIGMKPEFISRIFRPFEQEDTSTTRRFGGTGLGMSISDQLVKLMGGQIVVESMPGHGSDFTVFLSLPVTENPNPEAEPVVSAPAAVAAPAAAFQHCRILMAEDNEINAMIAVEILTEKGAKVEVAADGQQAVEMFNASKPGDYDVILMDIQMPVMDGRTAARKIRAMKRPDAAEIPILALSADAFVEDKRLSRESGMNGHLTKPIDFDELWSILEQALQGKEHG